jgi:hypothetical protein
MKKLLSAAAGIAIAISAACGPASAQDDALGKCLVDNSTGKDREAFMRWMFLALAANPSVKPMTNISDPQKEEIDKGAAAVMNGLMLKDGRSQAIAAMRADGPQGMSQGFATFGRIAMGDLMQNGAVNAELEKMTAYLDKDGWEALSKEVAPPKP